MRRFAPLVLAVLLVPLSTSADVLAELQMQIQALIAQLSQLEAGVGQTAPTTPAPTIAKPPSSCPYLVSDLSRGYRGDAVRALQLFLISEGNLSAGNDTGFFGQLTERAVQEWQAEHGVVSSGSPDTSGYGVVGPKTRATISTQCTSGGLNAPSAGHCPYAITPRPTATCLYSIWQPTYDDRGCQNGWICPSPSDSLFSQKGSTTVNALFSAWPSVGVAPLSVEFRARSIGPGAYTVIFGDAAETRMEQSTSTCGTSATSTCSDLRVSHMYARPGAYIATLIGTAGSCTGVSSPACLVFHGSPASLGTVLITVHGTTSVTY